MGSLRTATAVTAATAKQRMLKLLICSDAPEQASADTADLPAVAGVDEVGRGALFGPVVAAAVISSRANERPGAPAWRAWAAHREHHREKLDHRIPQKCALAVSVAGGGRREQSTASKTFVGRHAHLLCWPPCRVSLSVLDHLPDRCHAPRPPLFADVVFLRRWRFRSPIALHRSPGKAAPRPPRVRDLDEVHPGYAASPRTGHHGTPEHRRAAARAPRRLLALQVWRSFALACARRGVIAGEPEVTGHALRGITARRLFCWKICCSMSRNWMRLSRNAPAAAPATPFSTAPMTDKAPLKLLCVTAHPDDECFRLWRAR